MTRPPGWPTVPSAPSQAKSDAVPLGQRQGPFRALVRSLRPHQWVKNLLVLAPAVAAHLTPSPGLAVALLLGFVAFSATASASYLVNDLVDLERDRRHPTKSSRPLAAGDLPPSTALSGVGVLVIAAVAAALALPPAFAATLGAYAVLNLAYSFWLKTRLLVDVIVLAVLYTIRVVAGSFLVEVELSSALVAFSIFVFFALAVAKRITELVSSGAATLTDASGRAYRSVDLHVLTALGTAATVVSCLVYSLYVMSGDARVHYDHPDLLWLNLPLLLYWQARVWVFALRGFLDDDPITFALRDRVSLAVGTLFIITVLVAA